MDLTKEQEKAALGFLMVTVDEYDFKKLKDKIKCDRNNKNHRGT